MIDETVHPFERAGLGRAPFRYAGMVDQHIQHGERVIGNVGGCLMTTKPGGTCAYCGTYILAMFNVQSSDGNLFHVGSDCIEKVGDVRNVARMRTDMKERKSRTDRDRIARAVVLLPQAESLRQLPHPNKALAQRGQTLWDYADFCLTHGGVTGRLSAARMIERSVKVGAPESAEILSESS